MSSKVQKSGTLKSKTLSKGKKSFLKSKTAKSTEKVQKEANSTLPLTLKNQSIYMGTEKTSGLPKDDEKIISINKLTQIETDKKPVIDKPAGRQRTNSS
jgi:hypothetical protein